MFRNFLRLFGIKKKKRVKLSSREHGNVNSTVALIRAASHPDLPKSIVEGPMTRIPAERKVYGTWCIRSPWHNGAWIAGYYNVSKDIPVSCANPENLDDYDDATEQHELAHRAEYKLGIAPPWHNRAWRRVFKGWYDMPALSVQCVQGGCMELADDEHLLPGADPGDVIEIDIITDRS
jgi:hypothetical protein